MSDSSSMMMVMMMGMLASCGMVCVGGLGAWYLKDPTLGGLLESVDPAVTTTPTPCPIKGEEWDATAEKCKKPAASPTGSATTSLVGKTVYIVRGGRPLSIACSAKTPLQTCNTTGGAVKTKWKVEAYTSKDGKKSSQYVMLKAAEKCDGKTMYLTAGPQFDPPSTWADVSTVGAAAIAWNATLEEKLTSSSEVPRQCWIFYQVTSGDYKGTYKIVSRKYEKEVRKYLESSAEWVGSGSNGWSWEVSDSTSKLKSAYCA